MLKAADIMTKDVATIRSSATVAEAVKLMRARDWRALIVDRLHEQDAYGMITETDVVYKVIAFGKDPNQVHVYEVMTKPCVVVNPDLCVEYVARLFADYNLLRAPVIQGELLGIISVSDIIAKSNFIEQPTPVVLENKLQDAIKEARAICAQTGPYSKECAAAWDVVQDLESDIAHQRSEKVLKTVLEDCGDECPEVMPT
jgi:CBS domain-containing protein